MGWISDFWNLTIQKIFFCPLSVTRRRAIGLWSRCLFTSIFQKFGYDSTRLDSTIRMGPKCTSVKTSNFRTFRFPNFSWQRKIPTLKFKKFQWDLVSFCEIGSVSERLVQFLWDWFSFCEIESLSARLAWLGQFQREWEGWISADGGSNVPLNLCWNFFFVTLLTFGT